MPIDKVARSFVPRVDQVPESLIDVPHVQVLCQCPAPCWAATTTLEALKNTGMPYRFHCTKCCPDEFRESLQAVADKARADPAREKGKPVTGIFSKDFGVILEGFTPDSLKELLALAQEEHPREREPVTITMTLDVGEWVDICTTLEQTAAWMDKQRKPDDPVHPRGIGYMHALYAKVKRYVVYEVDRQVIRKQH